MSLVAAHTPEGRTWIARPNCSLSARERKLVFAVTAAVSVTIGLAFSYVGAWPVMPFTGIELALLWYALRHAGSSANDFEKIVLESERLTIETRCGALVERHEFHPFWAHLRYVRPQGHHHHRLLIRSHGREIELGRALTDEQKMMLAGELKTNLGVVQPENLSGERS